MTASQAGFSGGVGPRRNWVLLGYGVALITAATLLVVAEPRGSAWSAYGLLCEALGVGCLLGAARGSFARATPVLRRLTARPEGSRQKTRAAAAAASRVQPHPTGLRVTQSRVIRSEWTKFVSLRSSRIGPTLAVVCIVGLALVAAAATRAEPDGSSGLTFDPGVDLLGGVELAPLAVGVLGVLVITGEYTSGLIRVSLTAVPTRMPLLWAKLAVVTGAIGAIALVSIPAAVLVGSAELRARGWTVDPTDPRIWATGAMAALYMMLVGVIGIGLGALLRTTASAISALVGVFFGVPILVLLLPEAGARWIGRYLPAEAGEAAWAHPHGWHITSRAVALIVFVAWAGALFAAASFRLLREDA